MLSIASELSKGFDFVRVDLYIYNIGGRNIFGELAFTPVAGSFKLMPECWDMKLGEKWSQALNSWIAS